MTVSQHLLASQVSVKWLAITQFAVKHLRSAHFLTNRGWEESASFNIMSPRVQKLALKATFQKTCGSHHRGFVSFSLNSLLQEQSPQQCTDESSQKVKRREGEKVSSFTEMLYYGLSTILSAPYPLNRRDHFVPKQDPCFPSQQTFTQCWTRCQKWRTPTRH